MPAHMAKKVALFCGIFVVCVGIIAGGMWALSRANPQPELPNSIIESASDSTARIAQSEDAAATAAGEIPTSARLSVPYQSQYPDLPTGCEITSAAMLLNFYGDGIAALDLDAYLSKSSDFQYIDPQGASTTSDDSAPAAASETPSNEAALTESAPDAAAEEAAAPDIWESVDGENGFPWFEGTLIGPDPDHVFVGDTTTYDGLLCNPQPIADALMRYLTGRNANLSPKVVTGASVDDLLQLVSQGTPVEAWVTTDMAEYQQDITWQTETGKTVAASSVDHAVVLIGYDKTEATVYANDPIAGEGTAYSLSDFKTAYEARGNMAIILQIV